MALTKAQMLDYIESTGMVIDFDRNYLLRRTRTYITELYSRANMYAHSLNDWGGVISKLLKNAERKADSIGYNIDNDQDWKDIHTILVEWDMGERTLTAEDKHFVAQRTEWVYRKLSLDMWGTALRYIEEAWNK
jgi:hypothetical protein